MKRRGPPPWLWLLLAVAALGGGYGVYWRIVHDRAVAILGEQAEAWRSLGYEVAWSGMRTGGFPLSVDAMLAEPKLASPPGAEPWSWSAERLHVSLRPWAWNTITLAPEGRQYATTPTYGALEAEAEGLAVTIDSDAHGLRHGVITSGPVEVYSAEGQLLAAAESVALGADRDAESASRYRLTADALRPGWIAAGDNAPERLSLDVEVAALAALAAQGRLDARALAAWAAADGSLTINLAEVDWADAQLGARGALALDRSGRWNGQLVVASPDPARALGRLSAMGVVDPEIAARAGAVAAPPESGESKLVEIPFTLRQGAIYLLGVWKLSELAPAF